MKHSAHAGFTLIELVLVIVILGILAGMAVPRFVDLSKDARISTVNGMAGSLRSAALLAHAMQLSQGVDVNGTLSVTGVTIQLSNGYPSRASIDDMMADISGFTYDAANGVFTANGAPDASNCAATYTPPATLGLEPVIAVRTSGC